MRNQWSGFTLIEILVATTLSALIFTGLVAFVGSGLGSVMRTQKSVTDSLRGTGIEKVMRSVLTESDQAIVSTGALPARYVTGVILETRTGPYPYVFLGVEAFTGYCGTGTSEVLQRLVAVGGYAPRAGETLSVGPYFLDPDRNLLFSGSVIILGTGEE